MNLLLVEDDKLIGSGLLQAFEREGYTVTWLRDGGRARAIMTEQSFDLVVLDLGLPLVDGMELLAQWRRKGVVTPVLVLTARDTTEDKVQGLDEGADDFLTKPFELGELLARLRALVRRHSEGPILQHGDLRLDCEQMTATHGSEPLKLSRREFLLLRILLGRPGKVYTRAQLEAELYEDDHEVSSNAVEVHVHNLRRKVATDLIETVRGIGYRIGSEH
ncbi:MAG: response regulator transcription factor [Halofilum sp. (in: g-proteobacteria)]|nr:response regulator transcription factor [Halofilum sp. (in: g-proteobacteria)]